MPYKHIILSLAVFVSGVKLATRITEDQSIPRSREHIDNLLKDSNSNDSLDNKVLSELQRIYGKAINPLENAYRFMDISDKLMTEGDISALPKMTIIGPWSTGKSTMINYLLNLEESSYALPSGASPTTTDFTVLQYGTTVISTDGSVLAMDSTYSPLNKFGHPFLQKLHGYHFNSPLLKKVTIIDTPGIIENQKQRERSYPFNDVCKWFLDHSEMIILVFDYTKLDVGIELEKLFFQLKGHESKVRIVLNKADVLSTEELMRVYGTLFWGLAPLMNVTEPPRVYVGSFWSKAFNPISSTNHKFFLNEEVTLLQDLKMEISNWVENKIVALRRHALFVRNHAIVVDQYLQALSQNTGIFTNTTDVMQKLIAKPENFGVLQKILHQDDINIHDTFPLKNYLNFFSLHPLNSFQQLTSYCGMFKRNCYLDNINEAIQGDLPNLLRQFQAARSKISISAGKSDYCSADDPNCTG